jgi:hypothetical protein
VEAGSRTCYDSIPTPEQGSTYRSFEDTTKVRVGPWRAGVEYESFKVNQMPYGFVLVIATAVLAVRHVRSTHASARSKRLVAGLAALSVLAPYVWPGSFPLAGVVGLACPVLQFAIGFYVVFHEAVWRPDAGNEKTSECSQGKTSDPSNRPDQ